MDRAAIQLLGTLTLRDREGREAVLATRKFRALIAYLAVEAARWHSRDRIAGLLWGRHAQTQARNSLTQALYEIRKLEKAIDATLVERDGDRLRLAPEGVRCDLQELDALLESDPLAAADRYAQELLADFELPEAAFADWLAATRDHYRERIRQALQSTAEAAAERGNAERGLAAARRLVSLEPLDERARRTLMRLLVQCGNRAEALRQYQVCEAVLRDELGVAPDDETRKLQLSIKDGEAAPAVVAPAPDPRLALTDPHGAGDRPMVAVLPFANLSDDEDSRWLSEGLVDDVIFTLSAFRWFRVLARTATLHLARSAVDHAAIRTNFGATYAVSGSVRRAGRRLRINVELVDCRDGEQLWSGRYDRAVDDLFDVEVAIAREVASAVEPSISEREIRRMLGRPPGTLEAYELLQRGYWLIFQRTQQARDEARRWLERAVALDPSYACPVAAPSSIEYRDAHADVVNGFEEAMQRCRALAEQALATDPRHPVALRFLAGALSAVGRQPEALAAVRRALDLCPGYATAYSALAFALDYLGDFDEARSAADETVRLRPHDPGLSRCIIARSIVDYETGNYECAGGVARESLRSDPHWWLSNILLAAASGQLADAAGADAAAAMARIRASQPGITLETMIERVPFTQPAHRAHLAAGLERAGWRDQP